MSTAAIDMLTDSMASSSEDLRDGLRQILKQSTAIPSIPFSSLQLRTDDTMDTLYFKRGPFARACEACGLDTDRVISNTELIEALLHAWYALARDRGESKDEVMEDLLGEEAETDGRMH